MYIDANQITALIEKCEELIKNGQIFIHPKTIIKDLEGLIDAEAAQMEKMVDDFEAEEYGRLQLEDSRIQKEVDFDWPGGV
jgi:hypothetical protein